MSEKNHVEPELTNEVEALLGTSFFPEGNSPDNPDVQELGFKNFIFTSAIRFFARQRRAERLDYLDDEEYEAQEWNTDWKNTLSTLAEVAFRYSPEAEFMSRQLALVNNATEYLNENWEELKENLFPDQQTYLLDIIESLHKEPKHITYRNNRGETHYTSVLGVTAVAPTGAGKSHLIKACQQVISVGQPLDNSAHGERPVRSVLVGPSLIIVKQLAEMLKDTFPDLNVGRATASHFDPSANIVVSTIDMFNKHFKNNKMAGEPVDVVMIDEVHHLSEPLFRSTFLTQWDGVTFGFTATPAYDLERDVRHIIPHVVEHRNIVTLIEEKRLNDGQIFTFLIDQIAYQMLLKRYELNITKPESEAIIREVVDTLVIEFVTPLLEEGRRGIIFCEQGNHAAYAKRLAERLAEVELSNGKKVTAKAMDSYSRNQEEVVAEYKAGILDVITTVDTGRQGLDADVDFVIINCNIVSRLRGHQMAGRGTRLSERFPVTVYAQFSTHLLSKRNYERYYHIEETFGGNETIRQGRTIRQSSINQERQKAGENEEGEAQPTERHRQRQSAGLVDISRFPKIIQSILEQVDLTPIGISYAGTQRGKWAVQEGMIPLHEILKGRDTGPLLARKLLRNAGYEWRGRYEKEGDKMQLVHYYHPEARDYLHSVLPKGRMFTKNELAAQFNVGVTLISHIIEENGIEGRIVVRGKGKPPTCYNEEEITQIEEILKTIPGTQPGDITVVDLAAELGIDTETVVKMAGLGDEERFFIRGSFPFTAAEAAKLRKDFNSVPMAQAGEVTLARIAEIAKVDRPVVDRNMTEEQRSHGVEKRYRRKRKGVVVGKVWPPHIAVEIVKDMERFQSQQLPAYLVPMLKVRKLVSPLSNKSREAVDQLLAEGGFRAQEMIITGTHSFSMCLTWAAVAHLRNVLQTRTTKKTIEVDFSRLPTGPDDLDPEKIAYAQALQQQLSMKPSQLKKYSSE